MDSFKDQVHLVTGGSRGIGRGIAEELGRHGARVVIVDPGCDVHGVGADQSAGAEVAAAIEASGGEVMLSTASVTDEPQVEALVKEVVGRWGRIDGLAHIAGILRDRMLHKMSLADFQAVVNVHLIGGFLMLRYVLPVMRGQNYGRILGAISSAGTAGNFGSGNYAAGKGGLRSLFMTAADENVDLGILVNLLMPAAGDTRMTAGMAADGGAPGRRAIDNATMAAYLLSRELGEHRAPDGEPFTAQLVHKNPEGWRLMSAIAPVETMYADPDALTLDFIAEHFGSFAPKIQPFGIPQLRADRRAKAAAAKATAAKAAAEGGGGVHKA